LESYWLPLMSRSARHQQRICESTICDRTPWPIDTAPTHPATRHDTLTRRVDGVKSIDLVVRDGQWAPLADKETVAVKQ
jgi:hypothetical protein